MLYLHEFLAKHGTSGSWPKEEAAYLLLQLHDFYNNQSGQHYAIDAIAAEALGIALIAAESTDPLMVALEMIPHLGGMMDDATNLVSEINPDVEGRERFLPRFEIGASLFRRTARIETSYKGDVYVSGSGNLGNLQIVRS